MPAARLVVWFVFFALMMAIFAPRAGLLFNGLDSQRIWDTNTPAAFQFLAAAKNHVLDDFFRSGHKYPLFGSYVFLPVIIGYYAIGRLMGIFHTAADFMNQYALGETNLFFFIRLEMLAINLFSLYLLFRLTRRFTPASPRAAWYALSMAVLNFYVTFFSVMPRIHSLAFFAVTLTLYAAGLLLQNKSSRNYWLAFGAAAIAGSVSQSGVVALVMPIGAHCYDLVNRRWRARVNRPVIIGACGAVLAMIVLGYPRALFWLTTLATQLFSGVVLGDSHGIPTVSFTWLPAYYLMATEFIFISIALAVGWLWLTKKTRAVVRFEPYDYIALIHAAIFFAVFSFSSVFSGRFMLAVFPSLFFLAARLLVRLEERKILMAVILIAAGLQAYGIIALTVSAWGGDTRERAARWLLEHSQPTDQLLSTIDPVLLGIVPHPDATDISGESGGAVEQIIRNNRLVGAKSRRLTYTTRAKQVPATEFPNYRFMVVATDPADEAVSREDLSRAGFKSVAIFNPHRSSDLSERSFIPWDFVTPKPLLPHPFALDNFISFGPTITIYSRN